MNRRIARRLIRGVIAMALVLGGVLAVGLMGGRLSLVVTSGISMNPVYYQGDLVVLAAEDHYQVGEIVGYRIPEKNLVALHRIIAQDDSGFVMKGDNNSWVDPYHSDASQIVGAPIGHVAHAGTWLRILTSPFILAVVAFGLTALGGSVVQTRRRRRRQQRNRAMTTSGFGSAVIARVLPLPRRLQAAAAGAAIAAALGTVLALVAWIHPDEQVATSSTALTRQVSFSYSAQVPPSPAYDDTTVRSPQPVFRRLTNIVTVDYVYSGGPGSASVAAELSTPSGWRGRVDLALPVAFDAETYRSSVTLDLDALEARAAAAADTTGLPAQPLTVAVVVVVDSPGRIPFTPRMTLNLEPLKLSLSGDSTVTDATTVTDTSLVPASLGIGPVEVPVWLGRLAGVILILAGIGGLAAVAVLARRIPPVSEADQIRRRYAPLVASVEPMTTPPHVRVVDASEFTTLAAVAHKAGQLVLHWSRGGIETFVVLDESTMYRYRMPAASELRSDSEPYDAATWTPTTAG